MTVINPKTKNNLSAELKFRTTRVRVFVWVGKDPKPVAGYAFVSDIKKGGVSAFFPKKFPVTEIGLIAFESETAKPFRSKITGNVSVGDNKHGLEKETYNWKTNFSLESASEDESKLYLAFFTELRARISTFARKLEQTNYNIKEGPAGGDALDGIDLDGIGDDPEKKDAA